MRRTRLVLGLLLVGGSTLLATSCGGPYRRSTPGERVELGIYTVDPQIPWNISTNRIWQSWTVDGYPIHELSFINGLKDGQALYPRLQQRENAPLFRSGMHPEDVAIFLRSTLEFMGHKRLQKSEPKPQPFGSFAGHRLEIEYTDGEDMEIQSLFAWAIRDQRLYLIHYRGVKEHSFPKYRDAVERIIASIR